MNKVTRINIFAIQLADSIDIKAIRQRYINPEYSLSSWDLFYVDINNRYIYITSYGAVVFGNYSNLEIKQEISALSQYCKGMVDDRPYDTFLVEIIPGTTLKLNNERIILPKLNEDGIKIILLNMAQTVALDVYTEIAESQLEAVMSFAQELGAKGRLNLKKKNMLKFIGSALSIRNKVLDNLYIFDSPDLVWDDSYLFKLNQAMSAFFEIQRRYKHIDHTFGLINSNLEAFRDLYQHMESNILEWIIIILILVEVLHTFVF